MVDTSFLEDHEGLHQDVCCYQVTHGDTEDQWLLDTKLGPTGTTEKVLNTINNIPFRAETVAVPGAAAEDDIYRPEVMNTIEQEIDRLSPQLRDLSLKIHSRYMLTIVERAF